MSQPIGDVRQEAARFRQDYQRLRDELGKMIVGMDSIIFPRSAQANTKRLFRSKRTAVISSLPKLRAKTGSTK